MVIDEAFSIIVSPALSASNMKLSNYCLSYQVKDNTQNRVENSG